MKSRQLILAMLLALGSASVFANHCPLDMKQIDEALSRNPPLSRRSSRK